LRARRSHEVVDVPSCPLLSPALDAVLPAVRALAAQLPAGAEIDLQAGAEGVHVTWGGSTAPPRRWRGARPIGCWRRPVSPASPSAARPSPGWPRSTPPSAAARRWRCRRAVSRRSVAPATPCWCHA